MHSTHNMPHHAPNDLREVFCDAIDSFAEWNPDNGEPIVKLRDQNVSLVRVCGLLWNCTDIMPGDAYHALYDWHEELMGEVYRTRSGTFAVGARMMKAIIEGQIKN